MLLTLAVIADSGRAMYETMVRPLSASERESLSSSSSSSASSSACRAPTCRAAVASSSCLVRGPARLTRPARHRARPGDGAAGRLEQPVPGPARATWRSRTASSRAGCRPASGHLRHPLERRPRAMTRGDGGSPPRPPSLSALDAPRAQRLFFDLVSRAEHRRGGTVIPESGPPHPAGALAHLAGPDEGPGEEGVPCFEFELTAALEPARCRSGR